jgi:hypothetical protein
LSIAPNLLKVLKSVVVLVCPKDRKRPGKNGTRLRDFVGIYKAGDGWDVLPFSKIGKTCIRKQ